MKSELSIGKILAIAFLVFLAIVLVYAWTQSHW